MRGSLDPRILWLTAAVTFWTAGFDIIYSCQDYEFDRTKDYSACRSGSASPARYGSRGCFTSAMIVCLVSLGVSFAAGSAELGGHRCRRIAAA